MYLVVTATPTAVPHYAFLDGYPKNRRFPYEFRIAGATPSGFEPGYVKPAAPGNGHWHSNGGGWVDNRANVASTAYVGPRAAVFGNSTVSGNARIEDLAWVNSGATVRDNAIVRGSALVQGGSNLSGSIVVGGDAEPASACGSGTYLMFNPNRGCDGAGGEADINPAHGTFSDAELAITGTTTPPTTPPTTTTAPPGGRTCGAVYRIVGTWQGGFQGEVTVTAGSAAIAGWTVRWTYANGQTITQFWSTTLTASGANVTAANVSYNGSLGASASTTFGFLANSGTTNAIPAVTCAAS